MSEENKSKSSGLVVFAVALLCFLYFGVAVKFLVNFIGNDTPVEQSAMGEFTGAESQVRWNALEEVNKAQTGVIDPSKVAAAADKLINGGGDFAPTKTAVLVPGSPTFLKQMAAAAETPAPENPAPKPAAETPAPENPAPKPAAKPAPTTPAPAKKAPVN